MELFQTLNDEGVTVMMITHDIDVANHAKRVLHIRDGQFAEQHIPEKKEAEAGIYSCLIQLLGKPAISAADEARLSILKDFTKNDPYVCTRCFHVDQESDLVIPLNDRVPILAQNRLPGYNTMDKEEYFQKELDALPEACDVHVVLSCWN